ncbi:IS3 family transposase [Vibrio alginolyticus]|uniref:IS3 family transposase n=1 Tax=Vibrio alginolyticus TaxID=663 RepID=UPI003F66D22D
MKSTTKRTQRDYSLAFKLTVVDEVEKGSLTYKQAQEKYGIQGCSTVLVWLRKHGRLDWSKGTPNFMSKGDSMAEFNLPPTPEQRIKELEKQLEDAQLKADFFEAVVNVMERDYGVRVNKKAQRSVVQEKTIVGLSVTKFCQLVQISRQAYYKQCQTQSRCEHHEHAVIGFVREVRLKQPRIGTRKLKFLAATKGIQIGRDKLFELLRKHRLLVRARRAYHRMTDSCHRFFCHPNKVKDGLTPTKPEQLWVADITYLPTQNGESYLSLVTDAYSRKIVGFYVDDNMKTQSVKRAFISALRQRQSEEKLIHHSDRGSQYCSREYQDIHKKHRVTCSMTDGYDCYQNALAERVNGILKMELLLKKPKDLKEARTMVAESVDIYNQMRPHTALKYKTPDEVHRAF